MPLRRGVVLDLVALDLGRRRNSSSRGARDRGRRPRSPATSRSSRSASTPVAPLGVEQAEQRRLLGVVGLGRIAGRRADAAVGLADQLVRREGLVGRVAPELACARARAARSAKASAKRSASALTRIDGIVVVGPLEALGDRHLLDAGGDDEAADIVRLAAVAGATKSASATFGLPSRLVSCWRSVKKRGELARCGSRR